SPGHILFFFSSRRRHTRFSRDWSSDVCSSDLLPLHERRHQHQPGQHRHHGEPGAGNAPAELPHHRQREQEDDELENQGARHHPAQPLPRVPHARGRHRQTGFVLRQLVLAHAGSLPNRARASPAVTTEPVITTPPPETGSWGWEVSSASWTAVSTASSNRGSTTIRSGPKTSLAMRANSSGFTARGEELRVMTTSSTTGSSAPRMPDASLSPSTPTTATSLRKENSELSVSASARAPCGLCAASTSTAGADRTRSNRPGVITLANASRTTSSVCLCSAPAPRTASAAPRARAALRAWCAPCSGRKISS